MQWYALELAVKNLENVVAWYRDVLGLEVVFRAPQDGFAILQAGPGRIAMKQQPLEESSCLAQLSEDRLVFEVADLEQVVARLQECGVAILKPPAVSHEGYQRCLIADPEGRRICLFQWLERRS